MSIKKYFSHIVITTALLSLGACSSEQSANPDPVMNEKTEDLTLIEVEQGTLRGNWTAENSVRVFKGIPFAKPPTGDLRWRSPQSPSSWVGIRDAKEAGPACWQADNKDSWVWSHDNFEKSEDCLHLNIWSATENKKAPVMVWFHGGAHTSGMSHEKIFDGTSLAKQGVVIVTANYRLGPMGYLAHPALSEESEYNSSGNYGLLDNIATLAWVKRNIAKFGGDSSNVTIFGQSAGSQSVCSLLVSPLATGLFHKAIGQSASCVGPVVARDLNGYQRGKKLTDALGTDNLVKMREASAEQLLNAATESGWENQSRITIDGRVLPSTQEELYQRGKHAKVPLLIGSLANEGENLFPMDEELSTEDAKQYLIGKFGEEIGSEMISLYQQELVDTPGLAIRNIATDQFMDFQMRRWAHYHSASNTPTYLYHMNHVPPAFRLYGPSNPDLQLDGGPRSGGAFHSGDLAFVFGNTRLVGHDWNVEDHNLSEQINSYWTNFAKTGNPNNDGLPSWKPFTSATLATQVLNSNTESVMGVKNDKVALFERFFTDK